MKNKIIILSILLTITGLVISISSLEVFGKNTLLAGFALIMIAIFLRILSRQIASVQVNNSIYSFNTEKTHIQDELMETTIKFQPDGALRPKLADREVILCPSYSSPINWVDTPAHISMGDSVVYKFVETEHGDSDIELGESYGLLNAKIDETPQYLEVYDYFTNEQVGVISLQKN